MKKAIAVLSLGMALVGGLNTMNVLAQDVGDSNETVGLFRIKFADTFSNDGNCKLIVLLDTNYTEFNIVADRILNRIGPCQRGLGDFAMYVRAIADNAYKRDMGIEMNVKETTRLLDRILDPSLPALELRDLEKLFAGAMALRKNQKPIESPTKTATVTPKIPRVSSAEVAARFSKLTAGTATVTPEIPRVSSSSAAE